MPVPPRSRNVQKCDGSPPALECSGSLRAAFRADAAMHAAWPGPRVSPRVEQPRRLRHEGDETEGAGAGLRSVPFPPLGAGLRPLAKLAGPARIRLLSRRSNLRPAGGDPPRAGARAERVEARRPPAETGPIAPLSSFYVLRWNPSGLTQVPQPDRVHLAGADYACRHGGDLLDEIGVCSMPASFVPLIGRCRAGPDQAEAVSRLCQCKPILDAPCF